LSIFNSCHESWLKTKDQAEGYSRDQLRSWLMKEGYLPEPALLPPCFKSNELKIDKTYNTKIPGNASDLATISLPKSELATRTYAVIHPRKYEYLVFLICRNWEVIREILFHEDNSIYSYSFPIPITSGNSPSSDSHDKRPDHFIYDWTKMAEEDLVIEAQKYAYVAKTDISNFYPSIYTHSIQWAFKDAANQEDIGGLIDEAVRLGQTKRSNSLPIGPSTSDIIAEIILSSIDIQSSKDIKSRALDVIITRFKDDYRILANDIDTAKECLSIISINLNKYHLHLNENKTEITNTPSGLFREHISEYKKTTRGIFKKNKIKHRDFFHILNDVFEIQKKFPAQSILNKFLNSIFTKKEKTLKIRLPKNEEKRTKFIRKFLSMLIIGTRISPKHIGTILGTIEQLKILQILSKDELKEYIKEPLLKRLERSLTLNEEMVSIWILYFASAQSLDANDFKALAAASSSKSKFLTAMSSSSSKKPKLFPAIEESFMINSKKAAKTSILKYLDLS